MNEPKSNAIKMSEALSRGGERLKGGIKRAAASVKNGASQAKAAGTRAAHNKVREISDRVGEDVTKKLRAKALDMGVPGFFGALGLGLTLTAAALLTLGLAGLVTALLGIAWLGQMLAGLIVLGAVGGVVYSLQKRERS